MPFLLFLIEAIGLLSLAEILFKSIWFTCPEHQKWFVRLFVFVGDFYFFRRGVHYMIWVSLEVLL